MGSCQHAGAGAANSVLVLNDQAACEAHFERDRLAVPALSRVECSVSSQLPCDLRTNTATYICGSAQSPTELSLKLDDKIRSTGGGGERGPDQICDQWHATQRAEAVELATDDETWANVLDLLECCEDGYFVTATWLATRLRCPTHNAEQLLREFEGLVLEPSAWASLRGWTVVKDLMDISDLGDVQDLVEDLLGCCEDGVCVTATWLASRLRLPTHSAKYLLREFENIMLEPFATSLQGWTVRKGQRERYCAFFGAESAVETESQPIGAPEEQREELSAMASEAAIPQRDQPKGARSQEARKRRWGKLKAKRRQRQMGGSLKGTGVEQDDMCLPLHEIAPGAEQATDLLLREASLREQALLQRAEKAEQRATAAEQRATAVRNRSRREIQTAVQRAKQSERSNGKAAGRKRKEKHKAEGWRAARKEEERVRKRKVPTGEALHSGERKHQRLLAESGKTGGLQRAREREAAERALARAGNELHSSRAHGGGDSGLV